MKFKKLLSFSLASAMALSSTTGVLADENSKSAFIKGMSSLKTESVNYKKASSKIGYNAERDKLFATKPVETYMEYSYSTDGSSDALDNMAFKYLFNIKADPTNNKSINSMQVDGNFGNGEDDSSISESGSVYLEENKIAFQYGEDPEFIVIDLTNPEIAEYLDSAGIPAKTINTFIKFYNQNNSSYYNINKEVNAKVKSLMPTYSPIFAEVLLNAKYTNLGDAYYNGTLGTTKYEMVIERDKFNAAVDKLSTAVKNDALLLSYVKDAVSLFVADEKLATEYSSQFISDFSNSIADLKVNRDFVTNISINEKGKVVNLASVISLTQAPAAFGLNLDLFGTTNTFEDMTLKTYALNPADANLNNKVDAFEKSSFNGILQDFKLTSKSTNLNSASGVVTVDIAASTPSSPSLFNMSIKYDQDLSVNNFSITESFNINSEATISYVMNGTFNSSNDSVSIDIPNFTSTVRYYDEAPQTMKGSFKIEQRLTSPSSITYNEKNSKDFIDFLLED